ncbi:crotonobetainyl-CoA:carnitine CoA-transferase CaiB-like acyl-CoA transferase [Acidovorax delafieldii]|uniref:Crotonobetainyl-CoA:carnitine CoA-transferase CaiB-like acyl-CoA transferase n=1 Tax=Acidovorax delafieldii TaxID=47920 RepID=A0A561XHX7_ACIDE|nr:CoA transferase [Acidovorax delafieldii]TWG35667.1 crotonobetainyl-CoA:carnitine CoA-transferase CaiB-like acyl-CoA transferase [Acidovorax delafieldii]
MFNQQSIDSLPVHQSTPSQASPALKGLRVIDFTHFVAGPLSTQTLADFGADVIKIEAPERGEDFRHYPTVDPAIPAQGGPFIWANRNKKSLALDMKSEAGLKIAKELIAQADVLVENFSSGVMDRFGLDYAACAKLNPRLVYCSISAYGREGPYADRLGFDPIAQAESGFISMNGYGDRQGVRTGAAVMDVATAMSATNAILLALMARTRDGVGQKVEVALFDTAILMTGFGAMQHLTTGYEPQRNGNVSPDTCPSGVFQSQDKPFYINCGNDKIFQRLFEQVLERPDLAHDPVLSQRVKRLEQRERIFQIMDEAFAKQPWSHWAPLLRAANVPHGQVRTLGEALASDEARSRGLVTRIPHPVKGWIPNIASPLRLARTPAVAPFAAPSVGQHTQAVLRETLGYDEDHIAQLQAEGAFGVASADAVKEAS